MREQSESGGMDHQRALLELTSVSVFGGDVSEALQNMTECVARALGADDCVLVLMDDMSCYSARRVADHVLEDLVPLAESACEQPTGVISAEERMHYRSITGVPLASDCTLPFAWLLLCRRRPVAFVPEVRSYLQALAARLSRELACRLADERRRIDDEQVLIVSRVDPVLGVANRLALEEGLVERVSACRRACEPLATAVIDVDGLDLINKRHGYRAGDAVLAHIARIARQHAEPGDLIARYASDSIALLLPGATGTAAMDTLTRILTDVDAKPLVHENETINLTLSAGISELDDDEPDGVRALARATAARERARVTGDVIMIADRDIVAGPPAEPDYAIGSTLGGVYQLRHEISRGGFGVVYRAEDVSLGRQTALKLLREDLVKDAAFVERFRGEAATMARIRNPNLVQIYAFGIERSNVYFAMELVEGHGLDQRIESARTRRQHVPLAEVASVIEQVGDALEAMHRAHVLHRDVKPENVLVDRVHRRCVLVDLGIAVPRGGEKLPAGTPGFTAPEVFGETGETPATDVYSLGALAYVLLTLSSPFRGGQAWEVLLRQREDRPVAPSMLRAELSPSVDEVLLAALHPEPDKRPQNARAFAAHLSTLLAAPGERRSRSRIMTEPFLEHHRTTIRNRSTEPSQRGRIRSQR